MNHNAAEKSTAFSRPGAGFKKPLLCLAGILFCMFLTTAPALAANVCQIGSKGYASLPAAVSAAKTGQTITMLRTVRTAKGIEINKKLTIDFAGKRYTFTGTGQDAWAFRIHNTVTVKNMNVVATKGFLSEGSGYLILQSGKYSGGSIENRGGKMLIKGGTIRFTDSETPNYTNHLMNGGTLRIVGGTFYNSKDATGAPSWLWNHHGGKCTITGGTFPAGLYNTAALTITGGKFKGNIACEKQFEGFNAKMTIKGGTFYGIVEVRHDAYAAITKGTFRCDGPSLSVHGNNARCKVSGGSFIAGIKCSEGAQLTLSGGKSTGRITAQGEGSKITINQFTMNTTGKQIQGLAGGNSVLVALDKARFYVKGGSFINKTGYGFARINGGKFTFKPANGGNWRKLFNVQTLEQTA